MRLNSWDILQNPAETAVEILGLVIDPVCAWLHLRSYTFFFLFLFVLLYSFSHMLRNKPSELKTHQKQSDLHSKAK
ncbi:MAG: hypothetical protein IPJ46_12925 [Anaerolineales bacterium]|nr:hypothetical protein [Anaerolineales bacterium]